ncbi:putative lipid II flippase FtsW [bacterium]|nr:putative lipid II flippase FtsW [bacterium]
MNSFFRRWEKADLPFLLATIALLVLGLVFLYSATCVMASEKFGDSFYYLKRQGSFALLGLLAMTIIQGGNYQRFCRLGAPLVIISLLCFSLLLVSGIGDEANGAVRWLKIGWLRFQPAEFAKIACVLYMSWALSKKGDQVKTFTYGILPMFVVCGSMLIFLLAQPDLGNAVVLGVITLAMLFLAGARVSYLAVFIVGSLPVLYFLIMGAEYRKRRMLAFLDPWHDPQNTSYQIVQSFTGFFKGGLWGQGLGNSQEKLYFLPEVHTDFIGSVVAEELGFIFFVALLCLFAFLIFRGLLIGARAQSKSGFLLAAGCSTLLGLQIVLNLSIIMGLLPTKGLPLPFVSNGGSSLLATLILCGLILSVSSGDRLKSSP